MSFGLVSFAARRLALRPARTGLLASAVFAATLLLSSGLLLLQAVEQTADRVVARGPSLVVSRLDAGGWAPIPAADADVLSRIPGVSAATARVWGVLPGRSPVTLVGDPATSGDDERAVVGPGLEVGPGGRLELTRLDGRTESLEVRARLPANTAALSRGLVIVPMAVARRFLLLPEPLATDLAVASVRQEEDEALVPEIARALGRPVRVSTRAQMAKAFHALSSQRSGLWLLLALPTLLGLALVVAAVATGGPDARVEAGRLKLLGWTTWDVARLHLVGALAPAAAAAALALSASYAGIFLFGGGPAAALLLGFDDLAPSLSLTPEGALLVLAEVAGLVLAPCAFAALLPAVRLARADPSELLESP